MIYLKSVLVGLLALIVVPICALVIFVVSIVIYTSVHPPSGEGQIAWDPVSLFRINPAILLVPVLCFFAGFLWEYRRLTR